ncbi:MAG: hypothetical protein QOE01_88 [Actinomycetota bacterium]|jgi:hypothetical protein|nr:hypothetical protein [Actinomycetota bacterium]
MSSTAISVQDVLARLRGIDGDLPARDGAAVFNHMYLTVTERVADGLEAREVFRDPAFMEALDVTFAGLWLEAFDASADAVPKAWAPLFEHRRSSGLLPIQFALAGMNAHIAHDLPVAVVRTCEQRGTAPEEPSVRADYEAVNRMLAACESEVRRSFLSEVERAADDRVGPLVHLVSSWSIDNAREVAWVNAEALWAVRRLGSLAERYRDALAGTVGMECRCLLTPVLR